MTLWHGVVLIGDDERWCASHGGGNSSAVGIDKTFQGIRFDVHITEIEYGVVRSLRASNREAGID